MHSLPPHPPCAGAWGAHIHTHTRRHLAFRSSHRTSSRRITHTYKWNRGSSAPVSMRVVFSQVPSLHLQRGRFPTEGPQVVSAQQSQEHVTPEDTGGVLGLRAWLSVGWGFSGLTPRSGPLAGDSLGGCFWNPCVNSFSLELGGVWKHPRLCPQAA